MNGIDLAKRHRKIRDDIQALWDKVRSLERKRGEIDIEIEKIETYIKEHRNQLRVIEKEHEIETGKGLLIEHHTPSVRTYKIFQRIGIYDMYELIDRLDYVLLNGKDLGVVRVREIANIISEFTGESFEIDRRKVEQSQLARKRKKWLGVEK